VEQRKPTRQIGVCCSLLGHSRQAFYQYKKQSEVQALQEELVVQQVMEERKIMKRLGGRKLLLRLHDFLQQHAIHMGRDAFFDLLRRHGLLVRRRKRKVVTTDSNHWLRKYPNLVKEFIPIAPNQLWVADITYLVLENGFAYLSLITDAFSHKIVGFYLSPDLSSHGCCQALMMAATAQTQVVAANTRTQKYPRTNWRDFYAWCNADCFQKNNIGYARHAGQFRPQCDKRLIARSANFFPVRKDI
jgi:hypothetical protein